MKHSDRRKFLMCAIISEVDLNEGLDSLATTPDYTKLKGDILEKKRERERIEEIRKEEANVRRKAYDVENEIRKERMKRVAVGTTFVIRKELNSEHPYATVVEINDKGYKLSFNDFYDDFEIFDVYFLDRLLTTGVYKIIK